MPLPVSIRAAPERWSAPRVALAALAGAVASIAGLARCEDRLGGLELLDGRGWYTPAEAAALFDPLNGLDANARAVCAATGPTIDMIFPLAWGLPIAVARGGIGAAPWLWRLLRADDLGAIDAGLHGRCAPDKAESEERWKPRRSRRKSSGFEVAGEAHENSTRQRLAPIDRPFSLSPPHVTRPGSTENRALHRSQTSTFPRDLYL